MDGRAERERLAAALQWEELSKAVHSCTRNASGIELNGES